MHYLVVGLIGIVTGIVSGLLGVGGGLIMVPAMTLLLSPPIRDIKQAIGTSLAVIIPTALIGVWKHHGNQNVDWRIAAALVPTAAVGAWIGAHLVSIVHADDLKRGFGAFLILLGVKLAFFK